MDYQNQASTVLPFHFKIPSVKIQVLFYHGTVSHHGFTALLL